MDTWHIWNVMPPRWVFSNPVRWAELRRRLLHWEYWTMTTHASVEVTFCGLMVGVAICWNQSAEA